MREFLDLVASVAALIAGLGAFTWLLVGPAFFLGTDFLMAWMWVSWIPALIAPPFAFNAARSRALASLNKVASAKPRVTSEVINTVALVFIPAVAFAAVTLALLNSTFWSHK